MSGRDHLLSSFSLNNPLSRRTLLKTAAVIAGSTVPLAALQKSLIAQAVDIEEIIVYGTDTAEIVRELNKRAARELADAAIGVGNFTMGAGGVLGAAGGAAAAVPEPTGGTKALAFVLVLDGAVLLIEGFMLYWLGSLLRWIAADPPRYPYTVDQELTASFFLDDADELEDSTDKTLLIETEDLARTVKSIWDRLEWWQAAKEESDGEWMDIHSEKFWANVDDLPDALRALTSNLRTTVYDLNERVDLPNNQSIFEATAQFSGRQLTDIPRFREAAEVIDWNSTFFENGARQAVRTQLRNDVVEPMTEAQFEASLRKIDELADYFASI